MFGYWELGWWCWWSVVVCVVRFFFVVVDMFIVVSISGSWRWFWSGCCFRCGWEVGVGWGWFGSGDVGIVVRVWGGGIWRFCFGFYLVFVWLFFFCCRWRLFVRLFVWFRWSVMCLSMNGVVGVCVVVVRCGNIWVMEIWLCCMGVCWSIWLGDSCIGSFI